MNQHKVGSTERNQPNNCRKETTSRTKSPAKNFPLAACVVLRKEGFSSRASLCRPGTTAKIVASDSVRIVVRAKLWPLDDRTQWRSHITSNFRFAVTLLALDAMKSIGIGAKGIQNM